MKHYIKSKMVVYLMLAVMTISVAGCGFLLYPERRGRTSGRIDPVVLIMDCLWLIPGVVPGVVALVVDFMTGGIYESGSAINVRPGDGVALRLRGPAPSEAELAVIVEGGGGETVATLFSQEFIRGEEMTESVTFNIPPSMEPGNYSLSLRINGAVSSHWTLNVTQ